MKKRTYNLKKLLIDRNGIRDENGPIINLASRPELIKETENAKYFSVEILSMHKIIEITSESVHIRNIIK